MCYMDNIEFENGVWWVRRKAQRDRGVKVRCHTCEVEFVTRKVTPRKYCYDCSPARPKFPRNPRPCEACGKDFKPLRQENRFCSNRCKGRGLRGEKSHAWKGGPTARKSYVNVKAEPDDPIAWAMRYESTDYVPEHRLVMARYLGRPLTKDELVHHVNGLRYDNRLANLQLWRNGHPNGQNVEDQIAWARDILERYGDYVPPSGQKRLL
jgi:hypothetical protein